MRQPHLCWVLFLILATFSVDSQTWARDLTYFHSHSQRIQTLSLQNTSPDPEDLWLLIYDEKFIEEVHFEIPPLSKKTISVSNYKNSQQQMSLLTKSDSLKIAGAWSQNSSTAFNSTAAFKIEAPMEITNLGLHPQTVEITYLNAKKEVLLRESIQSLNYMVTQNLKLKILSGFKFLEIKSLYPLHIPLSAHVIPSAENQVRPPLDQFQFLAEYEPGSQFIITLSDPELIEKARQEIKNPKGLIIFGELSLNHLKWNRNPSLPYQPRWSWDLQKITSLEPLAADWCQVYPEMLERMLSVLLDQVHVCFRGSRIIAEWPVSLEPNRKLPAPASLQPKPKPD
jgi:hypothetical protein